MKKQTKSYRIKDIDTGIFWKYKDRFVRVLDDVGSVRIGLKCKGKGNKNTFELICGFQTWKNIKKVKEFVEELSKKKVEFIED